MAERNTILIDVEVNTEDTAQKLGEVVKEISELRTEQKNLTKELQESDEVDAEKAKRLAEVQSELRRLKNEQKEYTSILQNESAIANNYGDSLDEQRRKLSDMQKAYDSLSASWRDSSAGEAFKKQLDEQYDAVIELEKATGRHQRNVGNYPTEINTAIPAFGKLDGVLNSLGTSMDDLAQGGGVALNSIKANAISMGKAFVTPPIAVIAAILSAIVFVAEKISEAFKKNDEASTNLDRAFSALQPVTTAIGKAFEWLALRLSELVLGFAKFASGVGAILEKLHLLPAGFAEASKGAEELVIATDNLEEAERQYTINSAKRSKEISQLRAQVAEKDKYTAKEREEFLKQAIALEQENLQEELNNKKERLRILEETAKQEVDTSDATANEIAQARAELYRAEESYNNKTRELAGQLVEARNAQIAEQKKASEEARRIEEERIAEENRLAEEEVKRLEEREALKEEILRKFKETAISLIEDETTRAIALEQDRYTQELEALQAQYEALGTLTLEEEALKNENLELLEQEHLARMAEIEEEAYLIQEEKRLEREELELEEELNKATSDEEKRMLELEQAQAHHDELVRMTKEEIDAKFASQEEYEKAVKKSEDNISEIQKKNALARTQQAKSTLESIGQAVNAIGGLIDELDLKEEESAKAQKVLALAQVAIQSGIAVATAVAECQKLGFPAAIPAVIVAVATIAANIASAVSTINGAKFADGGIVGGSSYAGDNVPIQVNSGEMVLNRNQQKNLFEIANTGQVSTGIDYDLLAMKIGQAIQQMPAPVLVYEEFTNFQENVSQNIKYAEV